MQTDTRNATLARALQTYLQGLLGVGAEVRSLEAMPDGHAGLTYGFELARRGQPLKAFILKLGPEGVRRSGSTDIFRQVKLLRALHAAGYPAPALPWAGAEDEPFGAPFIAMERLAGRTFIVWEPSAALLEAPDDLPDLWLATARAMGQLHGFEWRRDLTAWETPTTLGVELSRWETLLRHTQDETWLALGTTLLAGLRRAVPEPLAIGLIHGDFQPGNVLFDKGRLTGVIDWDLAGIGPQGTDIGWLLMMADLDGWAEGWKPMAPPPRAALLDAYWQAGGTERADLGWYQAFAHFRLAAIAGLNLKLHRDGRRPDPIWEKFAPSIPVLLRRGGVLL